MVQDTCVVDLPLFSGTTVKQEHLFLEGFVGSQYSLLEGLEICST